MIDKILFTGWLTVKTANQPVKSVLYLEVLELGSLYVHIYFFVLLFFRRFSFTQGPVEYE